MKRDVAMARAIGDWLRTAGVDDDEDRASISVDLADALSAAEHIARRLKDLLRLDPRTRDEADEALAVAGEISVYLFEELKWHVTSLERMWEQLLKRLDTLSQ